MSVFEPLEPLENTSQNIERPLESVKTKAEILASKLDKMNEHFGIVESTIEECSEYVNSIEPQNIEGSLVIPEGESPDQSVLDTSNVFFSPTEVLSMLKEDFMSVRRTLMDTLNNGRSVVSAVNSKLTMFDDDSANAELVSAFATLVNSVNQSAKMLLTIYQDIIKTQQLLEPKDKKEANPTGVVINNAIVGNVSDILKQLKSSREEATDTTIVD